ncbi:O-antigen ligase family protein [Asanoa sp. NPDC049518]|uniref:O-antigen ligase family protein n=1 Tax=unclassified Asanoa TaxID=2685164 RepID=UPI0034466CF2
MPSGTSHAIVDLPAVATDGGTRWWQRTDPWAAAAVVMLVATVAVGPVALLPAESPVYAGIANLRPTLHTYTVAVLVAIGVLAWRAPRDVGRALLLFAPFLTWLALLALTVWPKSALTVSGLAAFTMGAAAFAVGAAAGRLRAPLCWALAAVAWLQLLAVGLAAAGLPLRRVEGAQALDVLGRATGLTAHPGELSKVLFLCGLAVLALPQRGRLERWAIWLTLGAVFAGVWLTQSRTVLVAVVALVAGSVLLESVAAGRWQRRHFLAIGMTAVLGAVSLPWLIARFASDPGGGARGHVTGVAFDTIARHPWAGVGPNGYVDVVGDLDRLTQTGVPVHNIVLLTAAETGIAGALLWWAPVVAVLVLAVRRAWLTRGADLPARVLVSATPGILLIGMTGWGLMQGPYLLLFLLVVGFFGGWLRSDDR